ncbi:hypothetical protein HELRODRAFT_80632, partial [Helobdella robusta]|uniref:Medium-chain acyl-CoA ligase ACSF2, mitochondrial n=1 Tax=Helobdella robusta TaxID=6412 RepID=T1G431_HELRO
SYLSGPSNYPLIGVTIGQLMEQAAQLHPDKNAFVFTHQRLKLTFEKLLEESDKLAAGLIKLGAKYQDRVGIWAPNCIEWILLQYATARAGLILVNINPAYQAPELEFCLKKVGVKILVMIDKYKGQDYYETLHEICHEMNESATSVESIKSVVLSVCVCVCLSVCICTLLFSDLLSMASREEIREIVDMQSKLQFDDPINIQFTSGTTGSPKGATLSHHNIVNNALSLGYRLKFHERVFETKICMPVPLYHCFGMVMGSLQTLCHSATVVLPSFSFNARDTIKAVQSEKCTTLYGTPTMFIDFLSLQDLSSYNLNSLDTGIMAGAVCPVEIMKKCVTQLHMKHIANCYGTTENSPITFQSMFNDSFTKRTTTVGKVHDHVEAKIVDAEGNILPLGESGELLTRGYVVMKGYWGDHEQTEATMSGSWYKTGDLAVFDEEGYCTIIGRKKDMIVRGGENIYPAEIEQIVYKHPNVLDVQVIGVPDARLGEQVAAWIILKEEGLTTEKDIVEFCRHKMAYFKIPHYITFVKNYPLTITGKVKKYVMRKEALKLYDLEHLED